MKKVLNITFLIIFYLNSFGQDLMETALKNRPIIIESKAYEIKSKIESLSVFDFQDYDIEIKLFEKLLEDLKIQSKKEKKTFWKKSDFKNRIVITENEKVNLDSVAYILKDLSKKERKLEIRNYRNYNNGETFYRSFPLAVSKPIYSSDGNYAIIGFNRGNNGGNIEIYQIINGNWNQIASSRWAY